LEIDNPYRRDRQKALGARSMRDIDIFDFHSRLVRDYMILG